MDEISIRRADLRAEGAEMLEFLGANLPQLPHGRFFDWLYCKNPEGPALTWVAVKAGRMIGMAAAFPRRVYCCGTEARGYVLGDFCIDAEYRSLGVAVKLQRACLAGVSAAGARFALDFPSQGMLAVYRRLQVGAAKTLVRYAKPLFADRKIVERVRVGTLARGLSALANGGLRLKDVANRRRTSWKIAREPGPWGREFTLAARQWSANMWPCVARTAEYLNWRYGEHPTRQYEMLTARGPNGLRGYVFLHIERGDCTIDDLMAEEDAARHDLLIESIALARGRRAQTVSIPWLSPHPGEDLLRRCGFRRRESSPFVLMGWPEVTGESRPDFFVSHGDWES